MNTTLKATLLLAIFAITTGFGLKKNSDLATEVVPGQDGEVIIKFNVSPHEGIKVSTDGPWSLELRENPAISTEKSKFEPTRMSGEAGTFEVRASRKQAGDVPYKLVAFICTADKKRCFRDVHEGSLKID